jgi:hypothetical protein
MYGRIYLPTGKLDALYTTRISPTLQALVAAISEPARGPGGSALMVSLQHDVGRTCTEYSWSAEDSMWGVRLLHNFGRLGTSSDDEAERNIAVPTKSSAKPKRVDEEEAMEGGLKGRISAGAELYFSAKEKSAGGQCRFASNMYDLLISFMRQFRQESGSQRCLTPRHPLFSYLQLLPSRALACHYRHHSHPQQSRLFSTQCLGTFRAHTRHEHIRIFPYVLALISMFTATRVSGPWARNGGSAGTGRSLQASLPNLEAQLQLQLHCQELLRCPIL